MRRVNRLVDGFKSEIEGLRPIDRPSWGWTSARGISMGGLPTESRGRGTSSSTDVRDGDGTIWGEDMVDNSPVT